MPLAGNGTDATSQRALRALRTDVIPTHPVHGCRGRRRTSAGNLAFSTDFNDHLRSSIAPVFVFVMGLAFLLMLGAFRSVTIAAVSVLLNLLSVGAAFGIMVAIFQHGWGAALVGTTAVGRDRVVDPALRLRRPVRAVDGLPRVRGLPDPGGARPRPADPRGDLDRHPQLRRAW